MLISNKKRFIFVHIKKTAGSSITSSLARYDDRGFVLKLLNTKLFTRIAPLRGLNPLPHHVPAHQIREYLGPRYLDYFSFAFVRNPFDWQVSNYFFIKQSRLHPRHSEVFGLGFNEYLQWTLEKNRINLQSSMISDQDDPSRIIVDFVGKFESIDEDYENILTRLGLVDKIELEHRNRSKRNRDYQQYYDETSRAFIEQHYARDLRNFGYSF